MRTDTASNQAFGPYEIRAPLGRGGGGEVYRAWDPRLEREVALKILRAHSERDPDRVRRFIAEARAASALNHPNIITVFDAAVDGDTPYIVSELIDGKPLREEIARGPLPLKRLLDLATQIADALSAAHEAGIVHRDLKPENVMVSRAGRVKVLDFGLAQPGGFRQTDLVAADDGDTQTASGLRVGTIPYMSPEQARGCATDFRSDQFSFGLMLYEMAAGRAAFRRDTPAATLDAIINDDLPPAPARTVRAPLQLDWIIERCLAKEPGDRYGATSDLYRDLRTLRDRLAEAMVRGAPAAPSARKRWRLAIIAAAWLAAAVAAVLVADRAAGRQPFDPSALRFAPLATEPAYEGFPAWSPDGQTIAYSAEKDGVLQVFTRDASSHLSAPITEGGYDHKYPFWSPDGKRIYYISLARDRDSLWSVAAAGGAPQLVVADATRAAISPDGRTLAFLRDDARADIVGTAAVWLADADGAGQRRYDRGPLRDLRFVEGALAFAPDGRTLGLCAVPFSINLPPDERGWQFWILPVANGEQPLRRLHPWSDAAPRVSSFTWLPDGKRIVLGVTSLSTPGSNLWIADLERDRAWPLTRSTETEAYPSASPDGSRIVFTKGDGDYDLVELSHRDAAPRPFLSTSRNESDPVWTPEGQRFAYVTDRSGQDEIWLRSHDGRQWLDRPLITQEDFGRDRTVMLSSPSFSPDGQRIAYQRNGSRPVWPLRIWYSQVAGGPPVELLPSTHEGYQGAPTWSPDGRWIAYAEWTERQWVLAKARVGSGEPPVILRSDGVPNAVPRWSPRNDWITWEAEDGFALVSPDGAQVRHMSADQWLVHDWSPDGSAIFAIRHTNDLRLALVAIDVRTKQSRVVADLGPSPPVNNPVKGFSLAPDGRILTAMVRLHGDLWALDGLQWHEGLLASVWPFRRP